MQHNHFDKIPSTQIYLRDHQHEFLMDQVLISCEEQTDGVGRTGNTWDFYPGSLAMSFLITPNPTPSLTTIEIGILVMDFLNLKFNQKILLKWPNDLLNSDKQKFGGIIANYINSNRIIIGLGINFTIPTKGYHYKAAGLISNTSFKQKDLSLEIYTFILANRIIDSTQLVTRFNNTCAHLNNLVTLVGPNNSTQGVFKGININGEALLEIDNQTESFLSGSLLL
jgi:biotin-[acetyl-CoA-carboxylase] ligase BirA-like protein